VCAAALLLYHPLPDRLLPLPGTWCQVHGAALPLNPLLVGCTFLLLLWERIPSVAIIAVALLAGALIQ
jgi:chromate transporter